MNTTVTALEFRVLTALCVGVYQEYCSDVNALSDATLEPVNTIKGVIGSLTKKGLVLCDKEEIDGQMLDTIFPIVDNDAVSYGIDDYSSAGEMISKLQVSVAD